MFLNKFLLICWYYFLFFVKYFSLQSLGFFPDLFGSQWMHERFGSTFLEELNFTELFSYKYSLTVLLMEVLTLENLECHLNWKPESQHAFTESHIRDIIAKTERKIFRFPQFTVAYCCTLTYMHTLKGISDFNKAHKFLQEENIWINKQIYQPEERWLDCDFIVRANRLKLKEFENKNNMDSHTDELHQLSLLWADKRTKAAVYAIKAVTFSCFGPRGITMAIDACKNALLLTQQNPSICTKWQKFDWLWSCAFNMSRQTRQTPGLEANEEELRSWQEVSTWIDANKLEITEPLFYAQYAEAIMIKTGERSRCEDLLKHAIRLWKKRDDERKVLENLVIIIAQKFCTTYPKHGFEVKKFVEEINLFKFLHDDLEMYRRFTQSMNYADDNSKAIEILEKAEKIVGSHTNHLFDLQLLGRRSKLKSDEWVRREYNGLFEKYICSSSGLSTIYFHRARWLFHKKIYPTLVRKQGNRQYDDSLLDECIFDLVQAQSMVNQWVPPLDFKKKFLSVLKLKKSERPEYVAWFKSSFCTKEGIIEPEEIIKLYEQVIEADTPSERQIFAKKHLGKFYMECKQFSKAISTLRSLAESDGECRRYFVQSVLGTSDHSLDELRECLQFGSCDALERVLSILEAEKERSDVRNTLMKGQFFDNPENAFLFFNTSNYELCALIRLVLDNEQSFFLSDARDKSPEFVENIKNRLDRFLEAPPENQCVVRYAWRQSRLKMTISHLVSESQKLNQTVETLHTLREARYALDACISQFFNLSRNSQYPHAINRMKKTEKELLKKQTGRSTEYGRMLYLDKRLREEWLPFEDSVSPKSGVTYDVILDLLKEVFEKKGEIAKEIVNFVAKREHHIITKEAAWHAIWIRKDNEFQHHDHTRDITELEENLNEYRDLTKMFGGTKMTAYDLAHCAAKFVEQTLAVFVKIAEMDNLEVSVE